MRFTAAPLAGAYLVEREPVADERGSFARLWCADELAAHGLAVDLAQCSLSYNRRRGTLRGLHFQHAPHAEDKLVACLRGALFDVIVDVRPGSATFGRHCAVELTGVGPTMLFVPKGFAHGFQTLADDTEVLYFISARYSAAHAAGIAWDDPALGIQWPVPDPVVSERDRRLPRLADALGSDGR